MGERIRDVTIRAYLKLPTMAWLFPMGVVASVADKAELRYLTPEPLDVGSHVGNMAPSVVLGSVAGFAAMRAASQRHDFEHKAPVRAVGAAAALLTGLALNAYLESRWGYKVLDPAADGDVLDFTYGTAAAVISFGLATELVTEAVLYEPQAGKLHLRLVPDVPDAA